MEEFTTMKLDAEGHLLMEQPFLRLPLELTRKNFKLAQRSFERERDFVLKTLKDTANASQAGQDTSQTLATLEMMINRMQAFKRKMEAFHEEEYMLQRQSLKRLEHLNDLYSISSLADVKYDEWSRIRLDRLLVDYLLRQGYSESAKALAADKGIEDLVDLDVFVQCHRVENSLRNGSTAEALAWCTEHKPLMKKTGGALEFELRFQQYIELRRGDRLIEARQHAQRHLAPHIDSYPAEVHQAAGLLAYPPNTNAERYKAMYSQARWDKLAFLFVKTHHELFSLPDRPLLHTTLSAGLSALKTPSCHSKFASSSSNSKSSTTTVCPVCSTELNELARDPPYAHHSKSFVENDPIVLPNGRLYGRDRILELSAKLGLESGQVKDPTTGEIFSEDEVRKVYIS